uniref:Transcriptional regulator AsnC family (AsnC) n=1 Tax=uncultured marine thaumarchaeote SAT1000_07_E05 TaxID=1456364 RepID=A0A075I0I1_9ARCH|nr:transcriptional regulator AsnC family (asnC) [uncultured marine thaumarchaeote SAT1000_07_E05]
MDSKQRSVVIEELFKIPGVREVSEVTGRFDILVTMYAKNLAEMHRLISENIGKITGIIGSESFIEMKTRTKQMPYMSV